MSHYHKVAVKVLTPNPAGGKAIVLAAHRTTASKARPKSIVKQWALRKFALRLSNQLHDAGKLPPDYTIEVEVK